MADPEQKLWAHLARQVGGAWEAERIEHKLNSGIPDVAYSTTHHGWIELKVGQRPARATTPVRLPHFTEDQRNWITRHGRRGHRVFILLQVEDVYFLFGWRSAHKVGNLTAIELYEEALITWTRAIEPVSFLAALEGETPTGLVGRIPPRS
jgi:hypothetical protein